MRDVSVFRAEMLTPTRLWLACYLEGTGIEGDRVTFEVRMAEDGTLQFEVTEPPRGRVIEES